MTRKWARFDSDTLSSPAQDVTITDQLSGATGKEHSQFLAHDRATGGTTFPRQQFNGDTATNYAARISLDGGADFTAGNVAQINWDLLGANPADHFVESSVINLSTQEKLLLGDSVGNNGNGAGNVPNRRENSYKWVNTSVQINASRYFDDGGAGQFDSNTNFMAFMAIDQAIARFASMRESFQALTTPFNQRFVEWFSGATISSIWNFSLANNHTMIDAINEGFEMETISSTPTMDWGTNRPYDFLNSVSIWVMRRVSTTSQSVLVGASSLTGSQISANLYRTGNSTTTSTGFWVTNARDGTTTTTVITSVPVNNIFNSFKHELIGGTSLLATINGELAATLTTNLPIVKLMPNFLLDGGTKQGRVRYVEAFNK